MNKEDWGIPYWSLLTLDPPNRNELLEVYLDAPRNIKQLTIDIKTSAYLWGLIKTYDVSESMIRKLSFMVLQILLGQRNAAQLGAMLSTDLGLPNDKAQRMATEIERDLFAPVALELNDFLAQRKKEQTGPPKEATAQTPNLIDLRSNPRPPSLPWGK